MKNMTANISNTQRKRVYKREGFMCAVCSDTRYLQVHHVYPRARGGKHNLHNLVCLCHNCHANIHGIKLEEWHPSSEELELAVVEYLSDLYAENGIQWDWEEGD